MAFYILNTNVQLSVLCDEDMLNNHKAAAYDTPCKDNIARLEQGDVVFLYRNKCGIVAYGTADGNLMSKDFVLGKNSHEENYMQLYNFKILKKPLTVTQMRDLSNNLAFPKTMYCIDSESGVAFIKNITVHCL